MEEFFKWCMIINVGLLSFWAIIMVFARDGIYAIHNRFFPMSRQTHGILMFSFLGIFKIFLIIFNITPYVVLLILG